MRIYNGEENFESFYLKHFESLTDLQNCTECFKNLSIYSGSIYYQTQPYSTSSFNRILVENDTWLDRTFWKNGGNSFTSSYSIGNNNNIPLNFLVSGSVKMTLTTSSLNVFGDLNYTGNIKINNDTGSLSQFLRVSSSSNYWSFISTTDVIGLNSFTSSINSFSSSINIFTSSINSLTGSYFKQNGNSFGISASLGTLDNNLLNFLTNGSSRMVISSSGDIRIYNNLTVRNLIFNKFGTPTVDWNLTTYGTSMGGSIIINTFELSTVTGSVVEFSTNGDILSYGNYTYLGTLKPNLVTPFVGQFLKANTTSSNSWSYISTGDVTGLNSFTASINSVTGSYFLKVGGTLTGLGGSGSLGMFSQSISPVSQSNSSTIFVNSSNVLSQIDNNGYITTLTSLETSSTFASMSINLKPRLILVNVDETNGSVPTIYFHDGVGLQWIPTSKLY